MEKIEFVDIQRFHGPLREDLHAAAMRVINSGHYIGGPEVSTFEKEMAAWLGVKEICGVACATSGLFAALKRLGIGPGDEVITTCHTAIATAEAISLTDAQVVFLRFGTRLLFSFAQDGRTINHASNQSSHSCPFIWSTRGHGRHAGHCQTS